MDMQKFVLECRSCQPSEQPEQATELLRLAAELGEAILRKRNKTVALPYQEYVDVYNNCCGLFPKVTKLTDKRRKAIKAYTASGGTLASFAELIKKAAATPFLTGKNSRSWTANFDFIMKPENIVKICEDVYGKAVNTVIENEHSYDANAILAYAMSHTPKVRKE